MAGGIAQCFFTFVRQFVERASGLICTRAGMFDPVSYREFNQDDPVLCHELGHAVVWFSHGEVIGPIRFYRSPVDNLLEPRAGFGTPRNLDEPNYAEHLAERWLAGQSAARRNLNIRRDRSSTKGSRVTRDSDLDALLRQMDEREDFARVLWVAHEKAGANWYAWIATRLTQAVAIIDENWCAIDRTANALKPQLPVAGTEISFREADLTTRFHQEGVRRNR